MFVIFHNAVNHTPTNKCAVLLAAWLFLCSTNLSMQYPGDHRTKNADSLENVLHTNPPAGVALLNIYWDLSRCYLHADDYEKIMYYSRKGITLAEEMDSLYIVVDLYNNLGVAYDLINKEDSAMLYFGKALKAVSLMENRNDQKPERIATVKGLSYSNIADLYSVRGNMNEALEYYFKALKLFEKYQINKKIANVFYKIGIAYLDMNNNEQAEIYLLKTEKIDRENNDEIGIAHALIGLSYVYQNKKNYADALTMAKESLSILEKYNTSLIDMHGCYSNLSAIYLDGYGNDAKAMEYTELALEKAKELKLPFDICNSLMQQAYIFLFQKKYAEAEKSAFEALQVDSSYVSLNQFLYECIFKANIGLGNIEKAHKYFDRFKQNQIAYANNNFQRQLSEMEIKYETEQKEHEIEQQQHIITRRNMQNGILATGTGIFALVLVLLWNMLRLRNRHNLALMERNDTLVEMNATKDRFFSIISHDMKNPAIAQRDALQTLVNNTRLWDADTLTGYANELLKSAEGQVELIYNLLDWARVQTGQITRTSATFGLSACLRSDISMIRNMAKSKGITFTAVIPDDALITGDGNMLATIVRNLLVNAVKFTAKGGRVTLTVEAAATGKYTVAISDTGIGMNHEQMKHLFLKDNMHSKKGTTGEHGSGLGLIVCKELLEKLGSELHVESEEGKGSRFWFEI